MVLDFGNSGPGKVGVSLSLFCWARFRLTQSIVQLELDVPYVKAYFIEYIN